MKAMRFVVVVALLLLPTASAFAQARGARGGPPGSPKTVAPVDLTGYWEAVVVEDWRYRMLPPIKFQEQARLGERNSIPMNAEARKAALTWDPQRDETAGETCRAYGAPNIMRIPGRIRITWRDDVTLKLETEAGTQTRLFEFGTPKATGADWQGVSTASWDLLPGGGRGGPLLSGSLKVVTSRLRAGYLQKNGIPYSSNAVVTEYFARVAEGNGDSYLVITAIVEDPTYLTEPYLTSTHFKRLTGGSAWKPSPCVVR